MKAVRTWGLWVVLAVGLALAWLGVRLPGPTPASAPSDVFSAERAMAVIRDVGRAPHPTGSPENERVRGRVLARMAALGLSPQVREGVGVDQPKWSPSVVAAATTHDLLGVLPGRDPSLPALMLMAHYDSVPNSPGAADDAAGVATALETVRALRATGPHPRDVMVLITDAEESGLLGAESFFHADPMLAHVGLVLNMETRGDSGRAAMFETGRDSGALTTLYGRVAKNPDANSLTSFVYHVLPNDTDFTHVRKRGLPGLNFAFVGDQLAYHTPLATPDHLSRASLQNMGDQVWPTARALADAPVLPDRTPDRAFSDVWGLGLVSYPPAGGWLVVLAAAVLTGAAAWRAARDGRATGWEMARGAAAPVAAVCGAALALMVAGVALGGADYARQYHLLARPRLLLAAASLAALAVTLSVEAGARRGRGLASAAVLAVAGVGVICLLERRLDVVAAGVGLAAIAACALTFWRASPVWGGWIGALVVGTVLAAGVQFLAPLTAMLFAWPVLLAAAAAALAAVLEARRPIVGGVLTGAAAVLALAVLGGWAEALFTALGASTPIVLAPFVLLLLPTLHPLMAEWSGGARRGFAALVLGLASAGLFAWVGLAPSPSDRPDLTQAFAYDEPAAGLHLRVSALPALDAWSRRVLAAGGASITRRSLTPPYAAPVWTATARAAPEPAPLIALTREGATLRLVATPTNSGQRIVILMKALGGLSHVSVNSRETTAVAAPDAWLRVVYDAPPATGVDVRADSNGVAQAVVAEVRDGWPEGGLAPPPKPSGRMAWGASDRMTVVARAGLP